MITFENVTKTYDNGTVAVDSLNFEIKQGEFFVIIGPSGCGKTTTLKMINRLIPLTGGTIFIDDKKISEYQIHELRWNIGYVLQQIALFPHMTIEENITIVPEMKQWADEKIKQRSDELLKMVGLDPATYADRTPDQLSGGEQQRVGVIRALAADPNIILMDEPFSALDPISREKLQDDLLNIKENLKKTTVFVTHDMNEALLLADRICLMKDGKVAQIGTPHELVNNPATDFVKQFVGDKRDGWDDVNLRIILEPLEGTVQFDQTNTVTVDIPIDELLEKLSVHDQLAIEENKLAIGMITRRNALAHLSKSMQKRGDANE